MTGLLPQHKVAHALRTLDAGVIFMSDQESNRARASFKVLEYLAMNIPIFGQVVGETYQRFSDFIQHCNESQLSIALDEACTTLPQVATRESALEYAWPKSLNALEAALKHAKPDRTL